MAEVIVESYGGKPTRILDATGSYWNFDDAGKIDESFRNTSAECMELAFALRRYNRATGTLQAVEAEKGSKQFLLWPIMDVHRNVTGVIDDVFTWKPQI